MNSILALDASTIRKTSVAPVVPIITPVVDSPPIQVSTSTSQIAPGFKSFLNLNMNDLMTKVIYPLKFE